MRTKIIKYCDVCDGRLNYRYIPSGVLEWSCRCNKDKIKEGDINETNKKHR